MQHFIRFCAALTLSLVFPAVAFAYYSPNTVTTPYWCGSYWSSLPCSTGWNMQDSNYQYQNYPQYTQQYQYPYQQQYSYYYPYQNYQYQNNSYQNGYWGYCYQTVAPGYGYSYRYPCFYRYQQYQYNNYNYYNPYQYNYSTQPYYYQGMQGW